MSKQHDIASMIGRQVDVIGKGGKVAHKGIVLGDTISGVQVGLTWTSVPGAPKPKAGRYISVFYAAKSKLRASVGGAA